MVQDLHGLFRDVGRVERPVGQGEELGPDHGTVAFGIYHHADILCGCGAGDEVVFPDNGLLVFQEVLKSKGLSCNGNPRLAITVRFKTKGLVPVSDELGQFMTDLGP